jgi:hypothetical protein
MRNSQNYILISYVSKDRQYLKYARQFKKNLKKINITNYDITYVDKPKDLKYWKDEYTDLKIKKEIVCLQKPTLILNKLKQYQMPVICVDIDSQLKSKPVLPPQYFDNGFIFRKDRKRLSVTNGYHVHNYTEKSIRFLEMWEYLCQNPELTYLSDHHRLKCAIDLIEDENRILKNKTVILDVINLYNNVYIEGLTRVNKNVEYRSINVSRPIKKSIKSTNRRNKKFNILLCRMDRSNLHGNQRDAFQKALSKYANVTTVTNKLPSNMNRGEYMKNIFSNSKNKYVIPSKLDVNKVSKRYDCVFVDCEIGMFVNEDWQNLKIPKFATLHDLHTSDISSKYLIDNNFDLMFTRYIDSLYDLLPHLKNYKDRIVWQPGCVDLNLFKDYRLPKKYNVTLTGVVSNSYPIRKQIKEFLEDKKYFKFIPRPRDGNKNSWPVGIDYAQLLNQSKISITDTSKYKYPIMKIYEITRSNSLLMVDNIDELNKLGFCENKHFVSIDNNMINNRRKIEYYLQNENVRNRICKTAYRHTTQKHNSDYRAKEFINVICDFYNVSRKFSNIGLNNYKE